MWVLIMGLVLSLGFALILCFLGCVWVWCFSDHLAFQVLLGCLLWAYLVGFVVDFGSDLFACGVLAFGWFG